MKVLQTILMFVLMFFAWMIGYSTYQFEKHKERTEQLCQLASTFHYGDEVTVIDGFYKGRKGVVVDINGTELLVDTNVISGVATKRFTTIGQWIKADLLEKTNVD